MAEAKPKKPKMTTEERCALIQKLQDDLEDFVAEKSKAAREKKEKEPEDTRSFDEMLDDLANHPAFMKEVDYSKPLHPDLEGLMQLKYESEDPTARATSYKEDGNEEFKKKRYDIAADNYTEGITSKSPDRELNAVLYTNRAAAQFHRGNYRTSFNDCIFARKFKSDHLKAIIRGAQCCYQMKTYKHAIQWCDAALMMEPDNTVILELRVKADQGQKAKERDERKQAAQDRKEEAEERKLLNTIKGRGVNLASLKVSEDSKIDPLLLTALESHNPTGAKVHINKEGHLEWPVIFFYPEYTQAEFINAFNEYSSFYDHLQHMFGPESDPPSWDEERKYKPDDIEIYFESKDEEKMYKVSPQSTLAEALKHKKYIVYAGTPGFILLVRGSKSAHDYLSRYRQQ